MSDQVSGYSSRSVIFVTGMTAGVFLAWFVLWLVRG